MASWTIWNRKRTRARGEPVPKRPYARTFKLCGIRKGDVRKFYLLPNVSGPMKQMKGFTAVPRGHRSAPISYCPPHLCSWPIQWSAGPNGPRDTPVEA
jgi:hypothetical protein